MSEPVDSASEPPEALATVRVEMFGANGKYSHEETWRIPPGAIGPEDMVKSPDFHHIGLGPVLIPDSSPWGYPRLLMHHVTRTQREVRNY